VRTKIYGSRVLKLRTATARRLVSIGAVATGEQISDCGMRNDESLAVFQSAIQNPHSTIPGAGPSRGSPRSKEYEPIGRASDVLKEEHRISNVSLRVDG